MLSSCRSVGGCPNKISEVDYQLGHRQCATCRMTHQPLQEEEPVATPKKKTEAIDAEAGTTHAKEMQDDAYHRGYVQGVAIERQRNVGLLKQKACDAWLNAETDAEVEWAGQVKELALWLEGRTE